MNLFSALVVVSLVVGSAAASACGTHLPAVQSKIDTEELAKLQTLAQAASHAADEIFVGTVTDLTRPISGTAHFGTASFAVDAVLKGKPSPTRTAQWREIFTFSCLPSASFHSVDFRLDGKFIVYVRDGKVARSAAADHLRSGLFTLEEEKAVVAAMDGGGS